MSNYELVGNQERWLDPYSDSEEKESRELPRPKPMRMGRDVPRSDWCITAKAPKGRDYFASLPHDITYIIGQQEIGEGGFIHWQIFVQFGHRVRLQQVKDAIGDDTAHCEPRRGTPRQAADYCRKPETGILGTQFEIGDRREGKVNHMDDLYNAIREGATERDLAEAHFGAWARAHNACSKLIRWRDRDRARKSYTFSPPRVDCYIGATGTGKTRRAIDYIRLCWGGHHYRKPPGEWWDGYDGEGVVLIDDFDGDIPISTILQLLDGYGGLVQVPVKGGFVSPILKCVIFTSNKAPAEWWPKASFDQIAAFKRRVTNMHIFAVGDTYLKNEGDGSVIELE